MKKRTIGKTMLILFGIGFVGLIISAIIRWGVWQEVSLVVGLLGYLWLTVHLMGSN